MANSPKLIVVEYDPQWPQVYQRERAAIAGHIDGLFLDLEHVGSTSIPGLAAKPIIDMMAAVKSLEDGAAAGERLRGLGYVLIETGMARRFMFRRQDAHGSWFHLHVVEQSTWHGRNERLLRDYLLQHPELAAEYGHLKEKLATDYAEDGLGYTRAKTAFIQQVVDLARDAAGLPRVNVWED